MDMWIIVIGIVILSALIAGIAYALKKSGFRTTEMSVKAGIVEAKMERTPADAKHSPAKTPARTEVKQSAGGGAKIKNSGITAPADSGAKIDQKAKGEGSEINDSPVNLT